MSSVASLSSASSALATGNIHGHGHKKGSHVQSTDDAISDSTTAPVPVATQQNLFSTLLQSLEQVIGIQSPTAASPAAATNVAAGAAAKTRAAAASAAATSAASAGAATASAAAANGAQTAKPASSALNVKA